MMNQERMGNLQDPRQTIGVFYDKREAEAANQFLQEAGFTQDQVSVELEAPAPNQPVRETQAQKSAFGGAMIGALFGGIVGFFIAVVTKSLPETSVSLQLNPFALALAGSGIGVLGFGLMGAALGLNVPETTSSSEGEVAAYKYRVVLSGTDTDVLRAAETLRQQGIEV